MISPVVKQIHEELMKKVEGSKKDEKGGGQRRGCC